MFQHKTFLYIEKILRTAKVFQFYYTVVWMFASVILLFIYLPNNKNKLLVPEVFTCISDL